VTLKPPHETFVHTTDDLFQLWQDLMGPGGFAYRGLWMIFLRPDGELNPVVAPLEGVPVEPDHAAIAALANIVAEVLSDEPGSVAFLLSRPGPSQMLDEDRRWARALRDALGPELARWPVHLATSGRIHVFAPDDLLVA
jgi:hypothetical protein